MNQEKIGKFIAEIRKEKKLTQEELATKLGITKNAVSKWERGISMMDMSLLIPVCDILEVSITELLNGERIDNESLKEQTEKAIKNTIDFTDRKMRFSKIKSSIITIIILVLLISFGYFGYKFYLINKYTFDRPTNVEQVLKGINNKSEIKIIKRTLNEDEYFITDNFKIRNDFKDYVMDKKNSDFEPSIYRNESSTITFSSNEVSYQMIDAFSAEDVTFYGDGAGELEKNFSKADRKFFLLKNDINNDVDFLLYVGDNYYKENNIFMDKRTMMENYAFNSFCSIVVPVIDELIIIKGDYLGYIMRSKSKDKVITEVSLIRDNKRYGFLTNNQKFKDNDYLKDIISTIEFYE